MSAPITIRVRLTEPQYEALLEAVVLQETEYEDNDGPDYGRKLGTLKRAWAQVSMPWYDELRRRQR